MNFHRFVFLAVSILVGSIILPAHNTPGSGCPESTRTGSAYSESGCTESTRTDTACAGSECPEYAYAECLGSSMPYPGVVPSICYPDSLRPVMINHVGRHGARYATSIKPFKAVRKALRIACERQTITPLGEKLLTLVENVVRVNDGRWGELDSLGMAEQRGIAARMYHNFKEVFDSCQVNAISSYVPRAMMSMYTFNHQLDLLDANIEFSTSTGRVNSWLMRPFDLSKPYLDFLKSEPYEQLGHDFFERHCPVSAICRVLGEGYAFKDSAEMRKLAYDEYKVLKGLSAMSIPCDLAEYLTLSEINSLWRCFNFTQYLAHSASALSSVPADIAGQLLRDIVNTTDEYLSGASNCNVRLRFGHAETLMPLLSLMRIEGCYYISTDYDDISHYWRDFDIVPMGANLQMILFRSAGTGQYYLMTLLNERPVHLIPDNPALIIPWQLAKRHLLHLLTTR